MIDPVPAMFGLLVGFLVGLTGVKRLWRTTWGAAHMTAAKV